ncbi:MAG TPA: RraA family protein [Kofleriaceae bacterium]|nr:RraA family protein [Kofleriaceae bacterium]
MPDAVPGRLSHGQLLELRRWNTPTIFNGWEQVTTRDTTRECFNLEETRDFMPDQGSMVGRAITLVIEPSNRAHAKGDGEAWAKYYRYMAHAPGPKVVVVQDLDKPRTHGSFWGEISSNLHRALGCVGTIVDGGVRDVEEMRHAGFRAIARRRCVGHAAMWPVRWGCEVEVFGCKVGPGQLIHADAHGFVAIPEEDEPRLVEAAAFMDRNECHTMIESARSAEGLAPDEVLARFEEAARAFGEAARARFRRGGEWG